MTGVKGLSATGFASTLAGEIMSTTSIINSVVDACLRGDIASALLKIAWGACKICISDPDILIDALKACGLSVITAVAKALSVPFKIIDIIIGGVDLGYAIYGLIEAEPVVEFTLTSSEVQNNPPDAPVVSGPDLSLIHI